MQSLPQSCPAGDLVATKGGVTVALAHYTTPETGLKHDCFSINMRMSELRLGYTERKCLSACLETATHRKRARTFLTWASVAYTRARTGVRTCAGS